MDEPDDSIARLECVETHNFCVSVGELHVAWTGWRSSDLCALATLPLDVAIAAIRNCTMLDCRVYCSAVPSPEVCGTVNGDDESGCIKSCPCL